MEIECGKKILGRGASGIVFEGFWGTNPAAVKRLQLENVEGSEKEEEALRNLKHRNVVQLYDVKSDSNFRYYALELCEASLDKLFLKDGHPEKCCRRMPPREEVLSQLATGLQYIHEMGMTHRDIKPQNVLIWVNPKKEEQVLMKWADFGLSKKVNERGTFSISEVRGTQNWIAPELLKILQGEELTDSSEESTSSSRRRGTIQSDVFAEGLVFGYFYLDGEHIFGNSQADIANNILKNTPVNISKIQPTHVHDLVLKMLSNSPDKRITSKEVVEYLTEYRASAKRNVLPGSMLEIDQEKILEMGGHGIIFEGVWGTTRLPVAIKRVQLVHVLGKKQEESWLNLSHDNVVKLFHAENDSKFRYYALELCQASLDQIFLTDENPKKYRGPKPQTEDALYQLAMGLEYIHEMKLIHCDLKPKNVLVSTRNSSTVMKWTFLGLSKQVGEQGTCPINEIKGGLDWLAPEILKALENEENQSENLATFQWECCTFKSDVFAEGLVFGYLLLGGNHPYGSISRNIQTNIIQDDPVNMSKIQNSSIRDLTLKMLTYKPESRLTSSDVVKEFRDIWNSQQKEMEKVLFNLCTEPNPNLIRIKNVVNQGISVNCRNEYEMTPLLQLLANVEAYRHDDFVEIIHFFVEKKIDLNAKNAYGENALMKLTTNYKRDDLIDIIKLFIDNDGSSINCKNKYGTNILHYVCEYYSHENLIDIIQLLIEKGVEINCSHDYGYNALPVLCRNYGYDNLYDIIQLLIENGIEVHCNPNNEGNALNIIISYYKEENRSNIVELLIKEEIRQRGRTQTGSSSKAMKRKHC